MRETCFFWSKDASGLDGLVGTVDWQQLCSICFCPERQGVDRDENDVDASCCLGIFWGVVCLGAPDVLT